MKWENIVNCVDIKTEAVKPFNGTKMFLSTGALDGNTVVVSKLIQVTYDNRPSRANLIVHEGDIIFAKMQNTKKVLQITKENESLIVSTGFFVVRPRSSLDGEYLFEYLNSDLFNSQKDKFCTGATQKALTNAGLKEILIPLPDIETQKKVAGALKRIRLLIEKRKEQIAVLDKLAKDTFIDMFGDPVVNPNGFDIRNLQEFYADSKNAVKCGPFGSALKKNEYTDQGIPVWTMDNITKNGNFINDVYLRISEEKYEQLKAYSVKDGDVIISRAGTVGKMCVVQSGQEKSIISTNLIRVRFNDELLPSFFVSLMTYCANRLARLKKGDDGAFTHMSTDVLNNINFPYPPLDLQKQYTVRIAAITRQKHLLEVSIAELETTYKATMQKAFDGVLF